MKLQNIIDAARAQHRQEHMDKEQKKLGVLRAGSTGIINEEGDIAGACHRVSLLRSKGIEVDPPTWDKYIMFELGYANEDVILKQLKLVLEQQGMKVLQEEEVPIGWTTENGTLVTGRPDIVVQDAAGKAVLGIELKSVHSVWTARDVVFNNKPKLPNLAQAAHYMWKLGLSEYKLFYKSYSQLGQGMAGNDWIIKQFPRPGEPGSDFIEYSEPSEAQKAKGKKATIKHIRQFEVIYDLRFDRNGRLQFKREDIQGVWTNTIITQQGIAKYFDYVSRMEETNTLGPLPAAVDAVGDKQNYTQCKYCPLQATCKQSGQSVNKWLQEVRNVTDEIKKTKETVKKSR